MSNPPSESPYFRQQLMQSKRAVIAVVVVALWLGGLSMMLRRNANRSEAQTLAEVALRIQPATFYYVVEKNGEQIGAASSALDTTSKSLVSEEYFVGSYPSPKGLERTSARWETKLTRGFRLTDFRINIARPTEPFSIKASLSDDTTLVIVGGTATPGHPVTRSVRPSMLTPALAPIGLMLAASPEIGRRQRVSVFEPTTRKVIEAELTISAESLFTLVDSAAPDRNGTWVAAHRDTVRAWRLAGAPSGVTAWVDAEGRIVSAKVGEFSVLRTAFEIAFKNSSKQ
ncbi:MAG: hypothetical protein ABR585_11500 [Gemmatimonadaceae bacterium]